MARGGAATMSTTPHQLGENTPINLLGCSQQDVGEPHIGKLQPLSRERQVVSSPSIPSFLPSLVSLFCTCTSLTSISCSDSVPTSLTQASVSSLSSLTFHLLTAPLPPCLGINLSYKTTLGQQTAFLYVCHGSCEDLTTSQF